MRALPRRQPRPATGNVLFFREWLRAPLRTASIVPSSAQLGRIMARVARAGRGKRILELGGGTGSLTAGLLASGVLPGLLDVIENNASFVTALRRRFPGVRIVPADATMATAALGDHAGNYGAVVSGLPLLAMSPSVQRAILSEALALLAPGGVIVQFSYSPLSPVAPAVARELNISVERAGLSLRNLPPAWVYRIERRA